MTIILKGGNVAFVHIPKTGGTWVREVLKKNNLVESEILKTDIYATTEGTPKTQHNVPLANATFMNCNYVFSFVRNPLTWYQSYWSFKADFRWYIGKRFDKNTAARIFPDFIEKIKKHYPRGYLATMFPFYTDICTHVGTQENLQDSLVFILNDLGFDTDDLVFPERMKVSPEKSKKIATYKVGQVKDILRLEEKVIEKYGYESNPVNYRNLENPIW
jgi:hypothetical protein